MIRCEEALQHILEEAPVCTQRETVPLAEALDRILAEPIRARWDLPRFNQSAVDGFAVRSSDVRGAAPGSPARLTVCGTMRAGPGVRLSVRSGAAARVMTGARLPAGADAVVMKESGVETDGMVTVGEAMPPGANVRYRGEEFARGAETLPEGVRVTPPVMGLLAACGYSAVRVLRRARITLLVTGDELVPPGGRLLPGCLIDSNSPAIAAACRAAGAQCEVVRVPDRREDLRRAVRQALKQSDIVLSTGGVSVGEYDLVQEACAKAGVRTVFWGVAIKPGKPMYFGVHSRPGRASGAGEERRTLVFGLPGNPVAALVCFHQLVRPALLAWDGVAPSAQGVEATLQSPWRKKAGRLEWLRGVAVRDGASLTVTPCGGQGSHMLGGLARANCLIRFPREAEELKAGDTVLIQWLDWRSG